MRAMLAPEEGFLLTLLESALAAIHELHRKRISTYILEFPFFFKVFENMFI